MLPAEIKCLYCVHCTIEETGKITCPTHPDRVPKEIVMRGPGETCGDLVYKRLTGKALEGRRAVLREQAASRRR